MSREKVTAVVLAGGRGRRLQPYTSVLPKPLMPVGDMPILEIVLRQLKYYGITDVVLATGYLSALIEAYIGDGSRLGLSVSYSQEDKPRGTAGPLKLIPDLSGTILLLNGDLLTSLNYLDLLQHHRKHKASITVSTFPREVQISLGVIETDDDLNIVDYIEKPAYRFRVSMGISALESEVLAAIPEDRPFDMPDLVKSLMKSGQKVIAFPFDEGYWLDIGRHEDYQKALDELEMIQRLLPGLENGLTASEKE